MHQTKEQETYEPQKNIIFVLFSPLCSDGFLNDNQNLPMDNHSYTRKQTSYLEECC